MLIAIIILALTAIVVLFWHTEPPQPVFKIAPGLDDKGLIYASQFWAGLCSKGGKPGGCYDELYFYDTGKFVKESGFTAQYDKKEVSPTFEKNIGINMVDQIIKKIEDSGVMTKDCPPSDIMDAGWDYQLNIGGVKRIFHNPPSSCRDIFDEIDNLLEDAAGTAGSFRDNNLTNNL